ncbi:MAG: hypothetical protein ABW019_11940 [Chitinophagaceae bacterium]
MKHLTKEALLAALQEYKGLIPVSILVREEQLLWLDMEGYHFYEGFFHKTLDLFHALKKGRVTSFITDVAVLEDKAVLTDYLYPDGFIFHAGRCGSTTLAKALARPQENLVISEARPHNSVWKVLTHDGEEPLTMSERNKAIYRHLILAMARRRRAAHRRFFIKFSSFNIRFFDFIHSVFPDVPALFLERDLAAILHSWRNSPPGWLEQDHPKALKMLTGSDVPDLEQIIKYFLEKAAGYPDSQLKHVDYTMLKAENLPLILSYLHYGPEPAALALMQTQLAYDSKVELNRKKFNA